MLAQDTTVINLFEKERVDLFTEAQAQTMYVFQGRYWRNVYTDSTEDFGLYIETRKDFNLSSDLSPRK